jgi:CheY-like chemotaxis protein
MHAMTPTDDPLPTGLRVLVVDDNVDAAESLSTLLGMLGHETAVAFDGPQGLALAEQFRPQVAVLDLGLPRLNGYELARRLRAAPHAPQLIVAVSGYGQPEDRRKSSEAGFDHHLTKPVELAVLQSVLGCPRGV